MIILNIAASPVLRGLPSPRKSTAGEVELLMSRAKATSACEFIMDQLLIKYQQWVVALDLCWVHELCIGVIVGYERYDHMASLLET